MVGEQVGVDEGQLHGVAQRLDLGVEPADGVVGDIGDLLQDELLDLGLGQLLEDVAGLDVEQQGIPGPEEDVPQRLRELDDPLLVGMGDDDRPAAFDPLLEGHDLALDLVAAGSDHVEGLVQQQLLALGELGGFDLRRDVHPELAAAGEDVDGAVLVGVEEDAVPRRGCRQLLDLLPEGDDLLPGLPEQLRHPLRLLAGPGVLGPRLEQVSLELTDADRGVGELGAEGPGFLFEELDLHLQLPDLALVFGKATVEFRLARHPSPTSSRTSNHAADRWSVSKYRGVFLHYRLFVLTR